MSATAAPERPPAEAFRLSEAACDLIESPETGSVIGPDGTLTIFLIRPCIGRGQGRHLYEADMLARDAGVFKNWRMFVDHETPQERRQRGPLPRPFKKLGGRVVESRWDPTVPPDPEHGFGQGAVVAKVRPTPDIKAVVENDPELAEASINARATGVRKVVRGGGPVWLVEGIEPEGSVDWVSEGGAGGQVDPRAAALMEAVYADPDYEELAVLESLTDDELQEHLRETRPELLEALRRDGGENTDEGGSMGFSPDDLREAATTDEGRAALQEAFRPVAQDLLREERDMIRAEARADSDRVVQLYGLEREAERLIAEAKLPEEFEKELKAKYRMQESGRPTDALDVLDELAEDSDEVVKPASKVLAEAVSDDVRRTRELIGSVNPTRVEGQGERTTTTAARARRPGGTPLWKRTLREAKVDPDKAFDLDPDAAAATRESERETTETETAAAAAAE